MEYWKDIKDYEGIYKISSNGRIKVLDRISKGKNGKSQKFKGKVLKPIIHQNGYLKINLIKEGIQKTKLIHRIVAFHFIKGNNELTVNHINGIKKDNRVENLEWLSVSENHKHAYRTGLRTLKGEKSTSNKLKNTDIFKIRNLLKEKVTHQKIADMYGVKRQTITDINLKRRWSHI